MSLSVRQAFACLGRNGGSVLRDLFGYPELPKRVSVAAQCRALRAYRDNEPSLSYGAVLEAASLISEALESLPEDRDLAEMSAVMAKLSGR